MKKKILSAILCATTLFGAVGFSACEVTDVLFADYKGQIAELEEKIAAVQTQNEDLQKIITEQQEQIAGLEEKKQELEGQANKLGDVLTSYENIILEEVAIDMVKLSDDRMDLYVPNVYIEVYSPIENVVFECVRSDEWGWDGEGTIQQNLSSNQKIYWHDYDNKVAQSSGKAYVDIYLKLNDNCVGYAVVLITRRDEIEARLSLLKSVTFFKLDGKYQQISKEEVDALIAKAKELGEGPDFVMEQKNKR